MFKTDNSLHVFAGGVYDKTMTAVTATAGTIFAVNAAGAAFTGAISGDFKIGQAGADGSVRMSPLVKFANATVNAGATAPRSQQVTTISAVSDVANTRYTLRLNFKNNVELFSQQSDIHFFEYVTGDTVTSGEVVDKFIAKIDNVDGALTGKVDATKTSNTEFYITGLAQTWTLGLHTDTVVSFDTTLDGFGAAVVTLTTAPALGSGNGRAVAELEWFGVGASGAPYRNNVLPSNQDLVSLYASSVATYGIVSLDIVLADPRHAVAAAGASNCQIVIALANGVLNEAGSAAHAHGNTAFGVSAIYTA